MEQSQIYRFASWSAYFSGIAALLTLITVPIFMAMGLPYDLMSNFTEIAWFILMIPIVIAFHQRLRPSYKSLSLIISVVGIAGALYTAIGTFLINFGPAGFGDSGMFETATTGFWFLVTNSLLFLQNLQPRGLSLLGLAIGISYMFGVLGLSMKSSWMMIFAIHILVVTLLYPFWAIWTGRILLKAA